MIGYITWRFLGRRSVWRKMKAMVARHVYQKHARRLKGESTNSAIVSDLGYRGMFRSNIDASSRPSHPMVAAMGDSLVCVVNYLMDLTNMYVKKSHILEWIFAVFAVDLS